MGRGFNRSMQQIHVIESEAVRRITSLQSGRTRRNVSAASLIEGVGPLELLIRRFRMEVLA
jgi:hypothetical protein